MALVKFGERAIEHGLADDQFADEIHHRIDARRHRRGACFRRRPRRLRLARGDFRRHSPLPPFSSAFAATLAACASRISPRSSCSGVSRLAARSMRSSETMRRDAAALRDAFFGLQAGQCGFDDFDGGGSGIVFRAQGDDGAATVQHVANQLKSGGVHQAIRIDAQRDVVDDLAAMDRFGDHELFVLGPGELCGDLLGRGASATADRRGKERRESGCAVARQAEARYSADTRRAWPRNNRPPRGQPRRVCVPACLRQLRGENIFEFMSELAELVISAGRGITLERVHGATHATNHFFVGGTRLEFEPGFVQRLQQLIRALKKERAKLAAAIFGRLCSRSRLELVGTRCHCFHAPCGTFASGRKGFPHGRRRDSRRDSSSAKTFRSSASARLRRNRS